MGGMTGAAARFERRRRWVTWAWCSGHVGLVQWADQEMSGENTNIS